MVNFRWLIPILFLPLVGHSNPVTLAIDDKIVANAEYRQGDSDKPTLLLLHGFLQTHNFHTIHQLTENLNDEGYSVLAPTLSLGIPFRKASLPCESIHTHTLQDTQSEIGKWISWLEQKGHQSIILIGHSTGSMMLLNYYQNVPTQSVKKFIGVSIMEGRLELSHEKQAALQEMLKQRIEDKDESLIKRQFSFCESLNATAESLYSYAMWTPDKILEAIKITDRPMTMIMGSVDDRLGPNWIKHLQETGKQIHIIEGANHFMDGEHEFELIEVILAELQ